jgi:hypothetical protein
MAEGPSPAVLPCRHAASFRLRRLVPTQQSDPRSYAFPCQPGGTPRGTEGGVSC